MASSTSANRSARASTTVPWQGLLLSHSPARHKRLVPRRPRVRSRNRRRVRRDTPRQRQLRNAHRPSAAAGVHSFGGRPKENWRKDFRYNTYIIVDFLLRLSYNLPSLLMRGVSGDDPEGGARNGVPRVSARCQCSREVWDPVRQALRPGCEEHRCTDREEMHEMEARPQTQNCHGGAPKGARSSAEGRRGASQAPRPAA